MDVNTDPELWDIDARVEDKATREVVIILSQRYECEVPVPSGEDSGKKRSRKRRDRSPTAAAAAADDDRMNLVDGDAMDTNNASDEAMEATFDEQMDELDGDNNSAQETVSVQLKRLKRVPAADAPSLAAAPLFLFRVRIEEVAVDEPERDDEVIPIRAALFKQRYTLVPRFACTGFGLSADAQQPPERATRPTSAQTVLLGTAGKDAFVSHWEQLLVIHVVDSIEFRAAAGSVGAPSYDDVLEVANNVSRKPRLGRGGKRTPDGALKHSILPCADIIKKVKWGKGMHAGLQHAYDTLVTRASTAAWKQTPTLLEVAHSVQCSVALHVRADSAVVQRHGIGMLAQYEHWRVRNLWTWLLRAPAWISYAPTRGDAVQLSKHVHYSMHSPVQAAALAWTLRASAGAAATAANSLESPSGLLEEDGDCFELLEAPLATELRGASDDLQFNRDQVRALLSCIDKVAPGPAWRNTAFWPAILAARGLCDDVVDSGTKQSIANCQRLRLHSTTAPNSRSNSVYQYAPRPVVLFCAKATAAFMPPLGSQVAVVVCSRSTDKQTYIHIPQRDPTIPGAYPLPLEVTDTMKNAWLVNQRHLDEWMQIATFVSSGRVLQRVHWFNVAQQGNAVAQSLFMLNQIRDSWVAPEPGAPAPILVVPGAIWCQMRFTPRWANAIHSNPLIQSGGGAKTNHCVWLAGWKSLKETCPGLIITPASRLGEEITSRGSDFACSTVIVVHAEALSAEEWLHIRDQDAPNVEVMFSPLLGGNPIRATLRAAGEATSLSLLLCANLKTTLQATQDTRVRKTLPPVVEPPKPDDTSANELLALLISLHASDSSTSSDPYTGNLDLENSVSSSTVKCSAILSLSLQESVRAICKTIAGLLYTAAGVVGAVLPSGGAHPLRLVSTPELALEHLARPLDPQHSPYVEKLYQVDAEERTAFMASIDKLALPLYVVSECQSPVTAPKACLSLKPEVNPLLLAAVVCTAPKGYYTFSSDSTVNWNAYCSFWEKEPWRIFQGPTIAFALVKRLALARSPPPPSSSAAESANMESPDVRNDESE